jgi:glycosyltransferase involved in cell wall biosynthesis
LPKVSVIIPNYNHARFLNRRIESVLNQTFTDFELILLDDCSTDDSVRIMECYRDQDSRVSLYLNEKNSGSTFAQWNKGVKLARTAYVWIAESDDYCEPTLLERLVGLMDENPEVGIAFAQSAVVDEEDRLINSFNENYRFIFKSNRWETDFIVPGRYECANYLIFSNTIPNASAALMRKSIYQACGGAEEGWRLNGDWYFYSKMLLISDLAYVAEHLNYFRMHAATQRHKARENHVVFDEIITTLTFITAHVDVSPENIAKAYRNVAEWWGGSLIRQKFSISFMRENWRLYLFFRKKRPRILLNVLSNAVFIAIGKILDLMGIKPVIKKWRARMFPGKYFEY